MRFINHFFRSVFFPSLHICIPYVCAAYINTCALVTHIKIGAVKKTKSNQCKKKRGKKSIPGYDFY